MDERRSTILIAEDDPDDLQFVRDALKECGYAGEVRSVKDGQDLMDYLYCGGRYTEPGLAPRPDLILLDLRMPKKDGLEALREIKADPALKSIPVVALTTSRSEKDKQDSYTLGAASFIAKPDTFRLLVEKMRALMGLYDLEG